ncbi:PRTRC system protein C [Bacteroides caccae]|uniref:PRTRC system protein C n=1 Tax=Bacteroides caccae TaxID=47678 RepID=UPI00356A1895
MECLHIKGLKRVFILKKGNGTLTLEDPDSRMSLSEVTDFYSINYPELTTATLHGPELEEDRAVYRFKTTIGTKG